jgi:hypothetical protein
VLGSGFDAVRVDFFENPTEPIFQELTFTSDNCKAHFTPKVLDVLMYYMGSEKEYGNISSMCLASVIKRRVCPCTKYNRTKAFKTTLLKNMASKPLL